MNELNTTNAKKRTGGVQCCVPGCDNHTRRTKGVSFHQFPKEEATRKVWIQRINRVGNAGKFSLWKPLAYHKICGIHFNKSGRKSYEDKFPRFFPNKTYPAHNAMQIEQVEVEKLRRSPLYDDEVFVEDGDNKSEEYEMYCATPYSDFENEIIISEHQQNQDEFRSSILDAINFESERDTFSDCIENQDPNEGPKEKDHTYAVPNKLTISKMSTLLKKSVEENEMLREQIMHLEGLKVENCKLTIEVAKMKAQLSFKTKCLTNKNNKIRKLSARLRQQQNRDCLTQPDTIRNVEKMLNFYTGFSDKERFDAFMKMILKVKESEQFTDHKGRPNKLRFEQQAILVLSRLRVGLLEQDLAYRFKISQSTVSRIFTTWCNFLSTILSSINIWPSKELILKYMPAEFKEKYPSTRVIIDCTELKIEKPSDYNVQSETYSQYKSHNTAKGLLAIAPCGFVSFVSDLYPGKISDKDLFLRSGLLNLLEMGDSVMGDKGFLISDYLNEKGVELNIPPFLVNASGQFTPAEVEMTRDIAALRIHVERVFSEVKSFRILREVFPNSSHNYLDQIWKICCLIQNFLGEPLLLRKIND